MAVDSTKSKKEAKGTIKANLGLDEAAQQQIVTLLNKRLADAFLLYTKTRNYHWNVTGIEFIQLHRFFEEQYDEIAEEIDEIAERVRQLGGVALGTLDEFKQNSVIEEQPGRVPSAEEMVQNLLSDHETIIRQLRKDGDTTEKLKDMGTNDFVIGLMEDHEKTAWLLRAHLEHMTK